jgi:hypothetical protein
VNRVEEQREGMAGERLAAVGVLRHESGHLERLGVTHLVEQRVEV